MRVTARGMALLIVGLVVSPTWGQPSPSVDDVLQMLRAGGYVIVVRHGATHPDQAVGSRATFASRECAWRFDERPSAHRPPAAATA